MQISQIEITSKRLKTGAGANIEFKVETMIRIKTSHIIQVIDQTKEYSESVLCHYADK